MERLINVFGGKGFIGSRYVELTDGYLWVNERNDYEVKAKEGVTDVLYFISTIDNYNVHTNPYLDIETNLTTLIKVLESCKGKDITFNFISSWFVYGDVKLPAKETYGCDPRGFYSITKRAAEQLLISYCKTFEIPYRIIRLGNVVGKSDGKASAKKNALQYMINEVKQGNPINLYEGGEVYRDYIYVDDVVSGINLILNSGKKNEIYNLANGEGIRLMDVMLKVKEMTNSSSSFNSIPTPRFHSIVQAKDMILDIKKIKKLGYEPQYPMSKMIELLV